MTETGKSRLRTALLVVVAVRAVLGVVAIPLAAALWQQHFVVVILLRPTKDVLLLAGFLIRQGRVGLLEVVAAAVPLAILGVWVFYALGRSYADEIQSGEGMPRWVDRVLPPHRIRSLCRILHRRGRRLVALSRLAAFPSALLGAAAGSSNMPPRHFLPADLLGAVLSVAEVVGAGYVRGVADKQAGPWLTVLGVAVLIGLLVVVGRWLLRDESSSDDDQDAVTAPGLSERR